jgi:hypothetical protein
MSLAIATIGCGKKIEEADSKASQQTHNQVLPSTYVIQLDGAEASRKNYFMPKAAQFEIPDRLKVKHGNTAGRVVEIAYDVNQYDNDDFQFKCSYVASMNPSEMVLANCVDFDGDDFGNVDGQEFTLRINDIIQLRFTGAASSDLVVEAIYSMEWI